MKRHCDTRLYNYMKLFKNRRSLKILVILLLIISSSILSASCLSCGPAADLRDFSDTDLFPPVILNILPVNESVIMLEFNETVTIESQPVLEPDLGEVLIKPDNKSLSLSFSREQKAGVQYVISADVSDETGNSMNFLVSFYGYNPNLPKLLINEFTCQGSTKHPDIVELLITKGGDLAGLWIVEGTTDYPEESICLPQCLVETGDLILIHFKPQGTDEEINETEDLIDISGGYDAAPAARDFWVKGGNGLSGNNGVIAVYTAPGGSLVDAVLYSNRTTASDEKYSGFGSTRMLEKSRAMLEEGGWAGTEDFLRPEDAVNPEDSTATRSICRASVPADTDSKADWHIVPTSSSSFGEINNDMIFEP